MDSLLSSRVRVLQYLDRPPLKFIPLGGSAGSHSLRPAVSKLAQGGGAAIRCPKATKSQHPATLRPSFRPTPIRLYPSRPMSGRPGGLTSDLRNFRSCVASAPCCIGVLARMSEANPRESAIPKKGLKRHRTKLGFSLERYLTGLTERLALKCCL